MKTIRVLLVAVCAITVLAGLSLAGVLSRELWLPLIRHAGTDPRENAPAREVKGTEPTGKILLSDQAITNLGLRAKAVRPQTYWKTIQVPGMVTDQPGRSDRGVVSTVTGVVNRVEHFPGDTVRPGDNLFTIRLLSESLQLTQSDLFKVTQNIKLAQAQRQRLAMVGAAIPEARLIEVANEITRFEVAVKAYRQDLQNRGLAPEQIDDVAEGRFVSEIEVKVPVRRPQTASADFESSDDQGGSVPLSYEVQELRVELGQQVQAGQTLCLLANHQLLAIEGRAFRDETPLLERSVKEGWPVEVDFQEDPAAGWSSSNQVFHIRYMSNTIDPVNRTFAFRMPLENQSRVVEHDGQTQILWRFRPGQKLRVHVRVEKLDNVFVVPAEAVAHDNPESFVFTQNVNTFERKAVRVLYQDRQHAVLANDGSLIPGMFVVQNTAAQLDRMAKSQSDSVPKGYHVHADGSLNKNEDEGK